MLGKFLKDVRGSFAPALALTVVPLVATTGAVVDFTNAYDQRTVVQDAMDAAAVAAAKQIGVLTTDEVKAEAKKFFAANVAGKVTLVPTLDPVISGSTVDATTQLKVKTYFLGMVGINEMIFDLKTQVTQANGTLEVALVLDNSGSMAGDKIITLRTAAVDLTTKLYALGASSTKPDPIKVALVPFAGAVNVDPNNKTSGWMDVTAVNPYHGETFEPYTGSPHVSTNTPPVNLFTLFDSMLGEVNAWAGCVEERPAPYDVQDDPASLATPKTMFVPMFAPDEPDNWTCNTTVCSGSSKTAGSGSTRRYNFAPPGAQNHNNYLKDYPTPQCGLANTNKWTCANGLANCNGTGKGISEQAALAQHCKYGTPTSKVTPTPITTNLSGGGSYYAGGPNFMCTTAPLTPLTTSQTSITTKIVSMQAYGITNITAGLMWGWRVLSQSAPFTEGRAYTAADNQKIVVLMTDGENTYFANGKFTKSHYGAWGYIWKSHLGTTSSNQDDMEDKEDERLALACSNAKAAGIKIYTVAFQVTDTKTLGLLEACATEKKMAFQSSSTTELLAAFAAIGDDISLLRIAK